MRDWEGTASGEDSQVEEDSEPVHTKVCHRKTLAAEVTQRCLWLELAGGEDGVTAKGRAASLPVPEPEFSQLSTSQFFNQGFFKYACS